MARFLSLSNTNLRDQLLLASLMVLVLAGFLILRHALQADATPAGSAHSLNSAAPSPKTNISSASQASLGGQSDNSSTTKLNVNGQDIPLPQNGSISQTETNENGTTTTINAQHSENSYSSDGSGQASNSSRSTVNVNVKSSSVDSL